MGNTETENGDEVGEPTVVRLGCRRCRQRIPPGEPGHLVHRRETDAPGLPSTYTGIFVCNRCLRREERGYQGDQPMPLPPIRLTPGEQGVLAATAAGRVYRATRGGSTGLFLIPADRDAPSPHDQRVTSLGYKLHRHRIIDFVVAPQPRPHNLTAWAVVPATGDRYLTPDDETEEEPLPSRPVSARDLKNFVTAAHYGRCSTTGGGYIVERVGGWDAPGAQVMRRDPVGRAALDAGLVTRDGSGVFDSTDAGREKYDLKLTAAQIAARQKTAGTQDADTAAPDHVADRG